MNDFRISANLLKILKCLPSRLRGVQFPFAFGILMYAFCLRVVITF